MTQDPVPRTRLGADIWARKLENSLRVSTGELKDFARMTGNGDVHALSPGDLCTADREIAERTGIEYVYGVSGSPALDTAVVDRPAVGC